MAKSDKLSAGSVQIHNYVIEEIVFMAIKEVDGITLVKKSLLGRLFSLLGRKRFSGIDIQLEKNSDLIVNVNVLIKYGLHIPDMARKIQDVVKTSLNKTTDAVIKEVRVNFQGLERG